MKKVFIAFSLIVFTISVVAFTLPVSKEGATSLTSYHYTSSSSDMQQIKLIDNWSENSSPFCPNGNVLPCVIQFAGNKTAFATYLQQFENIEDVLAEASEFKGF